MSHLLPFIVCMMLSLPAPAQHARGWIGDDGHKLAPSLSPNQWVIKTPAASADVAAGLDSALDQGLIGSCVAHGTTEAWDFAFCKATGRHFQLSRLMVYYNARAMEGTAGSDSGCQIVDAVKSLQKLGSPIETLWPYDVSKFRVKPPKPAYDNGKAHLVIQAFKVDNTDGKSIRLALTNGYPVVVGSLVYSGIDRLDATHYTLPMPRKGERPVGGHCYLLTGFSDAKQIYCARNSWGARWGNKGDFCVPYAYIHSGHITEDCWVILSVLTP